MISKTTSKAIGLMLLAASCMPSWAGDSLRIEKPLHRVDFNTLIEENGKESAALSNNFNHNLADSDETPQHQMNASRNSESGESVIGESHRVKEFLKVEMGLGDSAVGIGQDPSTQVNLKEDILFEEDMELKDEPNQKSRDPSNVATVENDRRWRKNSRKNSPLN